MSNSIEVDPYGHFVQSAKFSWTNGIPVWKYVSQKTGLSFILANVEGPLVHGEFAIATEAHDDDGCPHTLEHLVFLGSEQYPYKGVLDSLANRCFSQGTNAWTDTDHTAYTVSTAGSEGFLSLLPVYLDHILFPTLTDTGFHTEVHHITGEGADAGVVYCEMQGRQNTCEDLAMHKASQLIYPGDCGYKYETGGKVENLRDLTVHKVRDYHKTFYRPENLCLLVIGQVELQGLFQALHQVEEKILSKPKPPTWDRPWQAPVPPFTTSVTEKISFPSDDEESGMVCVAWRGPDRRDFETYAALDILWKYLTETAVAPLQQVFVEIDEPYCTDVSIDILDHRNVVQVLQFENVDKNAIGEIKDLLFKSLKNIISRGLNMNRIKDLIHRSILEHLDSVESGANHVISPGVITHFLYGTSDAELEHFVESTRYLEVLKSKNETYWRNLLSKMTIDTPHVCIEASPSTKLAESLQEKEADRIAKQVAALGEAKLKTYEEELQKANTTNNTPVPTHILEQFQIPDVTKVNFIPLRSIRNDVAVTQDELTAQLVAALKKDCDKTLPIDIQFEHVTSSLVEIRAVLDTSSLPPHLRPFLELYLDFFFELPVLKDGKLLSHEDVIEQLNRDTASYSNSIGFGSSGNFQCSVFGQYAIFLIKTEISKYEQGVKWLSDLLWHSQFTVERMKIANAKLLEGDIPQLKREGPVVVDAVMKAIKFDSKKSNHASLSLFAQNTFLEGLAKKLNSKKECNDVVAVMEEFRALLCNPANLQIQVASDLLRLPHPKSPWLTHFTIPKVYAGFVKNANSVVALSQSLRSSNDNKGYVIGLGAVESGYLSRCSECIDSYTHPDLPAVTVAAEFLEALEGPFWRLIRGLGLAYGFGIRPKVEEGMLYFSLYRSTNVNSAYQQAVNIINDIATKKSPIDKTELSAAISNAIFGIIQREASIPDTVEQSLLNYMKKVGPNGNKELLKKLQGVTVEDVYRVIEQYFKPLFQNPSTTVVVLNTSKVKETTGFFTELAEVGTTKKLNSVVRTLLE